MEKKWKIIIIVAALSCQQQSEVVANKAASAPWSTSSSSSPLVQIDKVALVQGSFVELAKKANPAVVNIFTSKKSAPRRMMSAPRGRGRGAPPGQGGGPFFDLFEHFFEMNPNMPQEAPNQQSLGSGFVISADGHVVTNHHVIAGADEIKVKFGEEERNKADEYFAEVVGSDDRTDLALLKLKAKGKKDFPFLPLGDSDAAQVGEWVMAVGNPFGLGHTVTKGIISAKGRDLSQQLGSPYTNFLQTDAAINPGNSGGPLVNIFGDVIGINSAINAGANNIGFAIPSTLAKRILSDLANQGHVTRGWLGVGIGGEVDEKLAKHFGLKSTGGVVIAEVFPGDPAARAGMKAYDIIVELDGKKINSAKDLLQTVADIPIGKKVPMKVVREKKEVSLTIEIAKRTDEEIAKKQNSSQGERNEGSSQKTDELGFEVVGLNHPLAQRFGIRGGKGVLIVGIDTDSPAALEGVRPGDVIVMMNRKPIENVNQYKAGLKGGGNSVLVGIQRGNANVLLVLPKKK